jgi:hypothetical protein
MLWQAGKGRAGLMSCCMLLRAGDFMTADEAIAHYDKVGGKTGTTDICISMKLRGTQWGCGRGQRFTEMSLRVWWQTRVNNGKGLTVTSQIKYVHYFERIWREVRQIARAISLL